MSRRPESRSISGGHSQDQRQLYLPQFDQLLVEEQGETDDAKRIAIFRQIAELLTEDAPVIPYHFGANVKGLTPNVTGFVHRADGLVRYVDIGLRQ